MSDYKISEIARRASRPVTPTLITALPMGKASSLLSWPNITVNWCSGVGATYYYPKWPEDWADHTFNELVISGDIYLT